MITSTQNRVTTGKLLALALLLAALLASLMLAAKPSHASTTFTVNSTEDHSDANIALGACDTGYTVSGAGGQQVDECTLRAAMEQANYTPGADAVNFAIPGSGVRTIAPATELPTVSGPLTINGYSQPGAQPNTKAVGSDAVLKIELSGAGAPGEGLRIGGANSTVKGLVINRWARGILIDGSGATGNKVMGNYIGTDASGTQSLGNGQGVRVYQGSYNTIGGTTAAARNVISSNGANGVSIGDGLAVKGNKVIGNYIGTDASGTKDLGNSNDGVSIEDVSGTTDTTIGGATAGERNVISGNGFHGIGIYGGGNRVVGNYLGTDASGTRDLGNTRHGVYIGEGSNNTVGGATAGERNVISGNEGNGVQIEGAGTTGNRIAGNYVGTDKTGAIDLGNSWSGVSVFGAPGNTVGGTEAAARNVISYNDFQGVYVYGAGATGNRVLSNSIFSNGELGIDLADTTANDPGDPDVGPNNLQNFPVLSSAKKSATGTTTVRGKLNSTPGKTFRVQFFSNPEGTDEGKTLLGSATVSTGASGDASFAFSTTKAIGLGQNITATATGADGTSEFSAPRGVVAQ